MARCALCRAPPVRWCTRGSAVARWASEPVLSVDALLNKGIHFGLLDSAHKIGTVLFGHPRSNTTPSSRLRYPSGHFSSSNAPCVFASSRARARCSGSGNALDSGPKSRLPSSSSSHECTSRPMTQLFGSGLHALAAGARATESPSCAVRFTQWTRSPLVPAHRDARFALRVLLRDVRALVELLSSDCGG